MDFMVDERPGRSPPGIIAAGGWCVDHVKVINKFPDLEQVAEVLQESRSSGGGPYNLLKDLAKIGANFPLIGIGLLGNDSNSDYILNDCRKVGINVASMKTTDEAATPYTYVLSVESSGRRSFLHRKGTSALLRAGHFDFERVEARCFHLAYLNLLPGISSIDSSGNCDGAYVLSRYKESGLRTSIDLASVEDGQIIKVAEKCLPFVDVLFANCFEIGQISGFPTGNEYEPDVEKIKRATKVCFDMGVCKFVIVHFPSGAIAVTRDGNVFVQGSVQIPKSKIRGTVGAGDAFAAGVIYGFHEGMTIEKSLQTGTCIAASCLFHPTTSEGILPLKDCLELGEKYGYRTAFSSAPSL